MLRDIGRADAIAFAWGLGLTRLIRVRFPPVPRRGLGRLARARPAIRRPSAAFAALTRRDLSAETTMQLCGIVVGGLSRGAVAYSSFV